MVTRMVTELYTAKGLYKAKMPYHDRVTRLCAFGEERSQARKGGCSWLLSAVIVIIKLRIRK